MISKSIIFLIRIYQRFISPMTPQSCKYYPPCSEYACDALKIHGPIKGILLATYRILRCNPWSRGGYDPVPLSVPLSEEMRRESG